jgi:DNA-binding protein HU-beta
MGSFWWPCAIKAGVRDDIERLSPAWRQPRQTAFGEGLIRCDRRTRWAPVKISRRLCKTSVLFGEKPHRLRQSVLKKPWQSFNLAVRTILSGGTEERMTQTQVATHLSDKVGITRKQAKSALDEITSLVVRELKREGTLRLAGLGIFRKRKTKARIGRNPATGEQIKIPARTRLRFTPAKALKDSVLGAR